MNYRHAFHAGNHADVLKHVVLLALCDALTAKPSPCFALDTHAGRGLYRLDDDQASRTGEAAGGVAMLDDGDSAPVPVQRYLDAVDACRRAHGGPAYPGSPWLLAHALRAQDAIACCELQAE
ncbi:MAG: 23S rRNA (adenine(2030)-N(6))-methyltransferase RlmJ, partial [Luteimonas sp.]